MAKFRLRAQKIKLSENDVEKACLDLLRWHHYNPQRLHSGLFVTPDSLCAECYRRARWVKAGEPGLPDYVIPRYYMEVKRPGGTLSEVQREKILTLKEFWGLETAVVESVDELVEWLAQNSGI